MALVVEDAPSWPDTEVAKRFHMTLFTDILTTVQKRVRASNATFSLALGKPHSCAHFSYWHGESLRVSSAIDSTGLLQHRVQLRRPHPRVEEATLSTKLVESTPVTTVAARLCSWAVMATFESWRPSAQCARQFKFDAAGASWVADAGLQLPAPAVLLRAHTCYEDGSLFALATTLPVVRTDAGSAEVQMLAPLTESLVAATYCLATRGKPLEYRIALEHRTGHVTSKLFATPKGAGIHVGRVFEGKYIGLSFWLFGLQETGRSIGLVIRDR